MNLGLYSGTLLAIPGPPPPVADIVQGLSRALRFGGRTRIPWSVAKHCLLVHALCPGWESLGHDAEEAILGDWPTPVVHEMEARGFAAEAFRSEVRQQVMRAFGVEMPGELSDAVKAADRRALLIEADMLCHRNMLEWLGSPGFCPTPAESEAFLALEAMTDEAAGWRWAYEVMREVGRG